MYIVYLGLFIENKKPVGGNVIFHRRIQTIYYGRGMAFYYVNNLL